MCEVAWCRHDFRTCLLPKVFQSRFKIALSRRLTFPYAFIIFRFQPILYNLIQRQIWSIASILTHVTFSYLFSLLKKHLQNVITRRFCYAYYFQVQSQLNVCALMVSLDICEIVKTTLMRSTHSQQAFNIKFTTSVYSYLLHLGFQSSIHFPAFEQPANLKFNEQNLISCDKWHEE